MASAQYIRDLEEANRRLTAELEKQKQQSQEQIRRQSAGQQQALAESEAAAQRAYTDMAQAAYLQKMQARRELPELLYRQGYNGGLTESALIRLENQYGQAMNAANRTLADERASLNGKLAEIRRAEAEQLAGNDLAYAKKYADLAYTYQRERAKALEEERAAALKAAAKATAKTGNASSKKQESGDKKSGADKKTEASDGYQTGKRGSSRYTYSLK